MTALRRFGPFLLALVATAGLFFLTATSAVSQPRESPPALSGSAPPASPPSLTAPPPPLPAPMGRQPGNFGDDAMRALAEPGSQIVITVLTFTPGDHPFFKFGHSAILVHDPKPPADRRLRPWRDTVYGWGGFAFEDPAVIPKFFQGRFMYWLDLSPLDANIPAYVHEGRAIDAQELDLTPAQKLDLEARLEENARPENLKYKYDYYRDNCATRVRDMIDAVIGGRVKAASQRPGRLTYRGHTLRLTESFPAEEVTLNLVMGDYIDQPITVWDEGFIPMELQKTLREVTVLNDDGTSRPLVKSERRITPPPLFADPPDAPPVWWPYSLGLGVVLGGVMAALGYVASRKRRERGLDLGAVARFGFGGLLSLFGFVIGFLGIFFLAAWAMTDHKVGYHNENAMLCAPWAVAFTGSGLRIMLGGRRRPWLAWGYRAVALALAIYAARATTTSLGVAAFLLLAAASVGLSTNIRLEDKLVRAALGLALLATIVKILPWFDQKNGFFILFFLPFWAGTAFGIFKLRVRSDEDEKAETEKTEAATRAAQAEKAEKEDDGDGGKAPSKKKKRKRPATDAPSLPPSENPRIEEG